MNDKQLLSIKRIALLMLLAVCLPSAYVAAEIVRTTGANVPGVKGGNFGSAAIADIDGDPQNGLEIAVARNNGLITVFRANGSILWSKNLPNRRCGATRSSNKNFSAPAVGNLLGDNRQFVVVGYGGLGAKRCGGGVIAFHGASGKQAWHFNLKRFAKKARFWTNSHTVYGTPTLADTNGNGRLEIGFGSFDRNVYLLDARGKVIWYYNAADTVWSSPSFANLLAGPELEMIIGTDISRNTFLKPPTDNGGYVYTFQGRPLVKKKKYEFRDPQLVGWKTDFDQTIFASPAVAELISTSTGPEIAIGSGCFFPQGSKNKNGKWFKVLNGQNGSVLRTLPVSACSTSTPAIGDLTGDGLNEIVVTVNGAKSIGGDGKSKIVAWNPENDTILWSIVPESESGRNYPWAGNFLSPVLADLDGNGSLEVLASNGNYVGVYEGTTGRLLARLFAGANLNSTPAVADLNNDGKLEVTAASRTIFIWSNFEQALQSAVGALHPYTASWPMYKKDASRNAVE